MFTRLAVAVGGTADTFLIKMAAGGVVGPMAFSVLN